MAAELEPRARQAARGSRRDPAGRWGPEWPLPKPAGWGRQGCPFWVRSLSGWARSPVRGDAAGATGGRARGKRAGLSFVRGFARCGGGSPCGSLLSPSRGGAFPPAGGARGVGLPSRAAGARAPCPNRAEAPPSGPRPPILSAAPSLSAPVALCPALARAPPPPSSPGFSSSRSGLPGGLPGRGGAAARKGRRAARQPRTSSERRARGAREQGSAPRGPSGAFCSQPEVSMPGP